jgi:hypothetical protein
MLNYLVEAQYPLDIFKEANISYSWETIYVGRKLKLLPIKEVGKYAVEYLAKHAECKNQHIAELAFGAEEQEINNLLKKVAKTLDSEILQENSEVWNLEWRKWRYCILKSIQTNIRDAEKLLDAISFVYADFGYPEDMISFIYYMPQKSEVTNNIDQNRKTLLNNFNEFLNQEKNKIMR